MTKYQAGFFGDDVQDIESMQFCKFSFAPLNAHEKVKQISTFNSNFKGGNGFIRNVVDSFFEY